MERLAARFAAAGDRLGSCTRPREQLPEGVVRARRRVQRHPDLDAAAFIERIVLGRVELEVGRTSRSKIVCRQSAIPDRHHRVAQGRRTPAMLEHSVGGGFDPQALEVRGEHCVPVDLDPGHVGEGAVPIRREADAVVSLIDATDDLSETRYELGPLPRDRAVRLDRVACREPCDSERPARDEAQWGRCIGFGGVRDESLL